MALNSDIFQTAADNATIPRDPSGKNRIEQREEEQKEVERIKQLHSQAKKNREQYDKNWDEYFRFYKGKQWPVRRPAYRSSPSINIIRSTIQTIVPIQTDAQPRFNVGPTEPSDYEFSDIVSELVDAWWSRNTYNDVVVDMVMDQCIFGVGVVKVIWDQEAEEGAGDVRISNIDPKNIYVPAGAEDFDRNCPWVIHEMTKPVGELKRLFPDKAEEIKASIPRQNNFKSDSKRDIEVVAPNDQINTRYEASTLKMGPRAEANSVRIWECWMDDWTVEEFEAEDEETGEKKQKYKYKYPGGKVVKILPDLGVMLETKPNPRKDGKKPFVRYVGTRIPREFYCEGEVEPLMDTQKLINKIMGNIIDYMNLIGNPVWIMDSNSGIRRKDLTNQVGLIIEKRSGSEVRRDQPPNMPHYYIELYQLLMRWADTASGIHDVTQGRKPRGVTAAEAIETLQEAAQTRLRLKERNLQSSLTRMGQLVVNTMMQYYSSYRVVRTTNADGLPTFFDFFMEETTDGRYIPTIRRYRKFENREGLKPEQNAKQLPPTKGVLDVKVFSGTALPLQKANRAQLALSLYDRKVIPPENLLKHLEWPDYEAVLRKLEEAQRQAIAQAQAQAQAQAKG